MFHIVNGSEQTTEVWFQLVHSYLVSKDLFEGCHASSGHAGPNGRGVPCSCTRDRFSAVPHIGFLTQSAMRDMQGDHEGHHGHPRQAYLAVDGAKWRGLGRPGHRTAGRPDCGRRGAEVAGATDPVRAYSLLPCSHLWPCSPPLEFSFMPFVPMPLRNGMTLAWVA